MYVSAFGVVHKNQAVTPHMDRKGQIVGYGNRRHVFNPVPPDTQRSRNQRSGHHENRYVKSFAGKKILRVHDPSRDIDDHIEGMSHLREYEEKKNLAKR